LATAHFSPEQLTERFEFKQRFKNVAFGLIGIGIVLIVVGALFGQPSGDDSHAADGHATVTEQSADIHAVADDQEHDEGHHEEAHADEHGEGHGHGHHEPTMMTRILSNLLLSGLYFMTIGMGALFFLIIHKVGNGGWHTAIRRVPEAITQYIPIGAIALIIVLFFLGDLYEWAILKPGEDALIDLKRGYLNQPFFIFRSILFFGVWGFAAYYIRQLSLKQDLEGGLTHFNREQKVSAFMVVFFALSYSLFAVDWIKSLEPHWFSTIFGVYIFAGSMVSSMVTIYVITAFLKQQGYMKYVNDAHFHDLGKYTFGFSVFWAYIWVAQFLLIWYSNIPEEGIYYVKRYRVEDGAYLGYSFMFYANVLINFITPFFVLMTRNNKRKFITFLPLAAILFYGHWHDLYLMIMPGAMGQNPGIGLVEIGFFTAFAGLFIFVVLNALSKANLVATNHPYLEESLNHSTGAV